MAIDQAALNQIAGTLARHFDVLFYVEIRTGQYVLYSCSDTYRIMGVPDEGDHFFAMVKKTAQKCTHPNDLEMVIRIHDRGTLLEYLTLDRHYSAVFRLILDGKVIHTRLVSIMCDDDEHIICALENVEDEYKKAEEVKKNLQSAERMARMDELTGIRNKNAFQEYSAEIEEKIRNGKKDFHFGVVVCDVNDLKRINDTRGHSLGDEMIQRTSRMICGVYKHSPVFRTGGDEFSVVLGEKDFEQRDYLLELLRRESASNKITHTGPVVASGMAVYEPWRGDSFSTVYKRADSEMYENKKYLKTQKNIQNSVMPNDLDTIIPKGRRRKLDGLFGAFLTMAGDGYVYLCDMRYDFSRWSIQTINDFGMESEYLYRAGEAWSKYVHPDDLEQYKRVVNETLNVEGEVMPFHYRVRKPDGSYVTISTKGFVLTDENGDPEYFGGIMLPDD